MGTSRAHDVSQIERISVVGASDELAAPLRAGDGVSGDVRGQFRGWLADAVELTKPRITKLVTITAGVGFAMALFAGAGPSGGLAAWELVLFGLAVAAGTALSSSGAGALNEWWERERDALMRRTSVRPIPAGRMSARSALLVGALASTAGVLILWAGANWMAAAVSLLTILTYVLLYTPLKPHTPLATLVGAVPGALPPLIGWTAVSGGAAHGLLEMGGWSLFCLMVVWQIPHFLAIAWMHREDYARGGFRVLPVVDPSGHRTAWTVVVWSVAMLPVSLAPISAMNGALGWGYAVVAIGLGLFMLHAAIRLARTRSDAHARRLFFASIIYLPVLLLAMVADAAATALL